jgi:putative inorganic carbon (HCO3(-)) transporter
MRKNAYRLYLVFLASWFLHLSERIDVLGAIRFDLLLLVAITALIFASPDEAHTSITSDKPQSSKTAKLLLSLLVYAIVTAPFVQWPGSVLNRGVPEFAKAIVFYFFTAQLVTTPARIRGLMLVFIPAMTFRVAEPLYLHISYGYWGSFASMEGGEIMERLAGAPLDKINGNGLAFVILTVIPFFHYLGPLTWIGRLAYISAMPFFIWTLLLTASRSGLLGFAIIVLAIWLKSRRKVLMGALVAAAIVLTLPLLSADFSDRYRSIFDSNTKNASTAHGRWSSLTNDLDVALRRPFFGHGLGTSREAMANFGGEDLPSHNLYTETAQELGFVGLAIFLATIWSILKDLRASLVQMKAVASGGSPIVLRLMDALQVWLSMNILFSFASYGLSSYEWYFAAGLAEVLRRIAAELAATAAQPVAAETSASAVPRPAPLRLPSVYSPGRAVTPLRGVGVIQR